MLDRRRSEELVSCILNVLHGIVFSIIQYGPSAGPVSEIAVLTHYKINADEEQRLSSAVVEFNQRHKESVSVIDIDYHAYLKWKDSTPFYQNIDRTGILLWSGENCTK